MATQQTWIVEVERADGSKTLVMQVEITCPECGLLRYLIPGHHLQLVRDMLIDAIDQYPDRSGAGARRTERTRLTIPGPGTTTPEMN